MLAAYTSIAGKYDQQPVESCTILQKSLLRYLKGQQNMCLVPEEGNQEGIRYYSDTDFAGLFAVDGEYRSRYGVLVTYNGMPVAYKSGWIDSKQKGEAAIKLSSGEAEVCGASEALQLCKHMQYIARELGLKVPERINIGVDASVVVAFANNTQCKSKMKHVNMRWGWVQELKDQDTVRLIKIPGDVNWADGLTKVLKGPRFKEISSESKKERT